MATYRFNTKLIKKFVDAQKERIAEVASNIAPTIYDTNKTVEVMDTMQVISITNTTYNINKLGIKGRDYVGVAMEILDKERYFNAANLRINNNCSSMALLRSSSTITSAPGEQRDNRILRPSTSAMISTSISSAGRPLKIGTIRLNEAGRLELTTWL